MTVERLTQNMRDILSWLADGASCEQSDLHGEVGRAHGVGSTLAAMEKRTLVGSHNACSVAYSIGDVNGASSVSTLNGQSIGAMQAIRAWSSRCAIAAQQSAIACEMWERTARH